MKIERNVLSNQKICFVIVYLGEFPIWFPAFLLSCSYNSNISWQIFGNAEKQPEKYPTNVQFKELNFLDFKKKASLVMKTNVSFENPKKLCDLKPMYGDIFSDQLNKYDYWGHCDLDLIWGDVESFLERINFPLYDIISSRKLTICGHFTLYRNKLSINRLYQQVKNYKKIFSNEQHFGFDEGPFSYFLYQESLKEDCLYNFFWPAKNSIDWPELAVKPYNWYWEDGKIIDKNGKERVYLHFMKWKKTVREIDFSSEDIPNKFLITRFGIWAGDMEWFFKIRYLLPWHIGTKISRKLNQMKSKIIHRVLKKPPLDKLPIPDSLKTID